MDWRIRMQGVGPLVTPFLSVPVGRGRIIAWPVLASHAEQTSQKRLVSLALEQQRFGLGGTSGPIAFDERREAHYPQQPAPWRWSSAAAATSPGPTREVVKGTEGMHWKAQRPAADLDRFRMTLSASAAAFEPDRFTMVIEGRPVQVLMKCGIRGSDDKVWFTMQSLH